MFVKEKHSELNLQSDSIDAKEVLILKVFKENLKFPLLEKLELLVYCKDSESPN